MENRYAAQERRKKAIDLIWMNSDPSQWEQGIALLREALALGDEESYYYLGRCYIWGDGGLAADDRKREGVRLYWEGAALGSVLCVIELWRVQEFAPDITGECSRSPREAFTEVMDLALNGEPFPCYLIGNAYYFCEVGDYLNMPDTMSREQKEWLWKQEAKRWFFRAVNLGMICAMNNLAIIYEENSDLQTARYYLQMAAERNSRSSCRNLGRFYEYGIGVEKDIEQALAWYQKGAELREAHCLWRIGCAWQDGELGKTDNETAHRYFLEALGFDDPFAPASLGREYECGWGVERDYAKAVEYYLLDLETEEDSDTPKHLGDIYCRGGYGVEPDLDRAWHYYRQSAKMENRVINDSLKLFLEEHHEYEGKEMFLNCQRFYEEGEDGAAGVLAMFYMEQLEGGPGRDCDKALELLEEGLKAGDLISVFKSLVFIGSGMLAGEGKERALAILEDAYAGGIEGAGIALARVLYEQCGDVNTLESSASRRVICLLEEAVGQGDPEAFVLLARIHLMGWGVSRDHRKALELLKQGIDLGSAECAENLARLYAKGSCGNVPWTLDYKKALFYAQQAAEGGCAGAYAILGVLYRFGQGGRRNRKKAREYFLCGYAQKNAECAMNLAHLLTLQAMLGSRAAKKQRFRYYWDAYQWGDNKAISKVAIAYLYGDGVEKNEALAFSLLERSAEYGSRDGAHWLSICYSRGIGVDQDDEKSKKFKALSKTLPYE